MVTLRKNQVKRKIKELRYFSESFKKDIVKQIEQDLITVTQVSREYNVSRASVYKWIYKYSRFLKKGYKYVVEPESDTKKIEYLRARLKEMEQAVGQKQLQVDFLEKLIELSKEDVGYDIKKKHGSGPYPGFGRTEKNIKGK